MADVGSVKERGQIKCYYVLRDYGFITRSKGKDLFFMRSAFEHEEHIVEGALVEFDIVQTPKGPKAEFIKRIG